MFRFVLLLLISFSAHADDLCVKILAGPYTCPAHSCQEREATLIGVGIRHVDLVQEIMSIEDEHAMVRFGLDQVNSRLNLTGFQKAMLWEEVSDVIRERIGLPTSTTYTGIVEGQIAYIFESRKRFNGQAYFLVVKASGQVLTGLSLPVGPTHEIHLHQVR